MLLDSSLLGKLNLKHIPVDKVYLKLVLLKKRDNKSIKKIAN